MCLCVCIHLLSFTFNVLVIRTCLVDADVHSIIFLCCRNKFDEMHSYAHTLTSRHIKDTHTDTNEGRSLSMLPSLFAVTIRVTVIEVIEAVEVVGADAADTAAAAVKPLQERYVTVNVTVKVTVTAAVDVTADYKRGQTRCSITDDLTTLLLYRFPFLFLYLVAVVVIVVVVVAGFSHLLSLLLNRYCLNTCSYYCCCCWIVAVAVCNCYCSCCCYCCCCCWECCVFCCCRWFRFVYICYC